MKISDISQFFWPRTSTTRIVPSYVGSQIAQNAKNIANTLIDVRNVASDRGRKVERMYDQSIRYTQKLAESAERNDGIKALKYASKLNKQTTKLFRYTNGPFDNAVGRKTAAELSSIARALVNSRLNLK